MTDFERIKFYYDKGWAGVDQLQQYVAFEVITPEEYEWITGQTYPGSA